MDCSTRREFLTACGAAPALAAQRRRRNVLFIAVDDLRPALGCYGDPTARTPNIDRLASRGTVFRRAYCQQAVCNPSRASLLTGRRPDTIGVWDLEAHFRDALPAAVTLPQHFKNNGYVTRGIGKIYHGNGRPSTDPPSWTDPPIYDQRTPGDRRYASLQNLRGRGLKRDSFDDSDVADDYYIDGLVCNEAVRALDNLQRAGEPFFLGVGFRKPHLPFCAPKKYWDLYNPAAIPAPSPAAHPEGAPEAAVRTWNELETYRDVPLEGPIPEGKIKQLRHGYYACVSYIDALIGRVLTALEQRGLGADTVVALWGDHGFHLGEQGLWTKSNNYELATRSPLIVSAPGQTANAADGLVELVDVYPTLLELCQLPAAEGLEGISLAPLMSNPNRAWKKAAFSQFPRDRTGRRHRGAGDVMGYALRTDRFRYVEWREGRSGPVLARELYDHRADPTEARNVADQARYRGDLAGLELQLAAGWRAALPN